VTEGNLKVTKQFGGETMGREGTKRRIVEDFVRLCQRASSRCKCAQGEFGFEFSGEDYQRRTFTEFLNTL
jgi:hypothetical protein